jgi:hypothetical protein
MRRRNDERWQVRCGETWLYGFRLLRLELLGCLVQSPIGMSCMRTQSSFYGYYFIISVAELARGVAGTLLT